LRFREDDRWWWRLPMTNNHEICQNALPGQYKSGFPLPELPVAEANPFVFAPFAAAFRFVYPHV
jgi:hypothetical protein